MQNTVKQSKMQYYKAFDLSPSNKIGKRYVLQAALGKGTAFSHAPDVFHNMITDAYASFEVKE